MTKRRRTASHEVSAALLNAAEAVLDRDGAAGVTVRAVASEAAVAPMSVYNRFDSKEGLLSALAMRALDELAVAIQTPGVPPADRIRQACKNYRDYALAHPARYLLIFSVGSPLQDQSSPAAVHGSGVFDVLVALVGGSTEDAQAVWSAVHGAVTIEIAGIGQTHSAAVSFERLLDLLSVGLAVQVST